MHSISGQRKCTSVGSVIAVLLMALLPGACSRGTGDSPSIVPPTPTPTPTPTPAPAPAPAPSSMPVVAAPAPAVAAPDKATAAARMQQCRASLEAGMSSGLVHNASVDHGRPKLWVGPAWHQSTLAAKEDLARDAACFFLSGDESKTIKFSVYDDSGREVAVWNLSRLVTW